MRVSVSITICIAVFFSGGALAAHSKGIPTPLTSIGATSNPDSKPDEDDPGAGGAFDGQTYFENRLTTPGAIAACATMIEAVSDAWAHKHALVQAERNLEPSRLTLDFVKADLKGIFEVTYRVQMQTSARVTLFFYAQNGELLEPDTIETFLSKYEVGRLQDALSAALTCGKRA